MWGIRFTLGRNPVFIGFFAGLMVSVYLVSQRWDSLSPHTKGMILAGYGLAALGIVAVPALRTRALLIDGAQAQGAVVDASQDEIRGTTTYHAVVRFTTADGRDVVFTSKVGYPVEPEVGTPVPVRYRRAHPGRAVEDRAVMWIAPAALGLLAGLGLLVAGAVVYLQ